MNYKWFRLLRFGLLNLLPIIIALSIAIALQDQQDIPIIYLRADTLVLVLLGGLIISIFTSVFSATWIWHTQRIQQIKMQVQQDAIANRSHFLSRLDHELKNPLTAIRVGIVNLAQSAETIPELQETIQSVELQTIRLSRLTADLRKLAELETQPIVVAPINLNDLLQEVVAFAQDQTPERATDIHLMLPQAPWPIPEIDGDMDLLLLATYNLVENALKFTKQGDTIELRAYENGTTLIVEVADTGTGIPEEEQPHVWEELYRGQGARGTSGSGLGLALVRTIVTKHRGQVMVRSRPGQGTVFSIQLPL